MKIRPPVVWLVVAFLPLISIPLEWYKLGLTRSTLLLSSLLGLLLWWGPAVPGARYVRWLVMFSLATFTSVLLNGTYHAELYAETIALWCALFLALFLVMAVSKLQRTGKKWEKLRKTIFCFAICFALSANWVVHTSFSTTKWGCLWILDLPFQNAIILPSPYDYYIISVSLRLIALASWLLLVTSAVTYLAGGKFPKTSS